MWENQTFFPDVRSGAPLSAHHSPASSLPHLEPSQLIADLTRASPWGPWSSPNPRASPLAEPRRHFFAGSVARVSGVRFLQGHQPTARNSRKLGDKGRGPGIFFPWHHIKYQAGLCDRNSENSDCPKWGWSFKCLGLPAGSGHSGPVPSDPCPPRLGPGFLPPCLVDTGRHPLPALPVFTLFTRLW